MTVEWVIACEQVQKEPDGAVSVLRMLRRIRTDGLPLKLTVTFAFRISGVPGESGTLSLAVTDSDSQSLGGTTATIVLPLDSDTIDGAMKVTFPVKKVSRYTGWMSTTAANGDSLKSVWIDVDKLTIN